VSLSDVTQLLQASGNVIGGCAILISLWALRRLVTQIDTLTSSVNTLHERVSHIEGKIGV
jgi:hypothetical protein